MAMSSNDFIKFLTEQLVTYMNKSKTERKKEKEKTDQPIYSNNWFGLFPFTIKLLLKR